MNLQNVLAILDASTSRILIHQLPEKMVGAQIEAVEEYMEEVLEIKVSNTDFMFGDMELVIDNYVPYDQRALEKSHD